MFDFVNRKKRVVQVIMGIAVLPFLFFGIGSYQRDDGSAYIAIVDDEEIPRIEFEQALRDQQDRMRNMLGDNYDSSIFDNPDVRLSVLESLIQQRLLRQEAINTGMTVLDSQLAGAIGDITEFHQDGSFSPQQYQDVLRSNGMNPLIFESRLREELILEQLLDAYNENTFISNTVAKKVLYLSEVQREINQVQFSSEQFLAQINPEDAAIQDYYDRNQISFQLPERVRVEYLVLSLNDLVMQQEIDPQEIKQYFDDNQAEYGSSEERQASHILFALPANVAEENKASILEKANEVLAQVRQDPEQFSALAEQYSEDPGSATQGGDLGFFGRGMMVKSFEDEIFQMQTDEISGLVETDFGFHIIKLTAIKDAAIADFDDVKDQIEFELKTLKAGNSFGGIAEDFSNTVYEQSETLQIAAQEFDLSLQTSDWIDRESKEPAMLANQRLLDAIFADDVIKDERNTSAIEVFQDVLVSARVLEHRTASTRSLSMVKDDIIAILKVQQATEMAIAQGEGKLVQLQEGSEDAIDNWEETKQVSYIETQGLDSLTMQAIFRANLAQLPAYTGVVDAQGNYSIIRITSVIEPDEQVDDEKFASLTGQLQQMLGQEEMAAYLAGLRQRSDVSIRSESF